ncbi:MAG: sugar-binding domain-containing protein [Bacteroidota bacterium]
MPSPHPSLTKPPIYRFAYLFLVLFCCLTGCSVPEPPSISLAGDWTVKLDPEGVGEAANWQNEVLTGDDISLPGTLAEADLGNDPGLTPKLSDTIMFHLSRNKYYTGKAWYQKDIELPADWSADQSLLTFERILWQSKLWVNGQAIGTEASVSTPHRYQLEDVLRAGKNTITVMVDNSFIHPGISFEHERYPTPEANGFSHAYSNHTQGKWNGIIGEMLLTPISDGQVVNIEANYVKAAKTIKATATFYGPLANDDRFTYVFLKDGKTVADGITSGEISGKTVTLDLPAGNDLALWDELKPNHYTLRLGKKGQPQYETTVGLRTIAAKGEVLTLNDQRIFLRGNLDCAVYPIKGRVDMDHAGWRKNLQIMKAYGFNHIRFHSWCPPRAAFEVADDLGMYLQPELPHWSLTVGEDKAALAYLEREADRIIAEYGNHPSFVMMSLGNELEGDFGWLNEQVARLKKEDPRRLYTTTTFSFQKGAGAVPQPEDEYLITQWTDRGWVRGQGYFNDFPPQFDADYQKRIEHIGMPIVAHEIGQYAVFPSLEEIPSYVGVAQPLNLQAIKQDLEKKGMLELAPQFAKASGQLAGLLYKADIERNLKTPSYDGYQVLQLQDYPGHGTALIGLLDVFLESKGIMDSTAFRRFNAPVVPLLRFPKVNYRSGENFQAAVQVANFAEPMEDYTIDWSIRDGETVLKNGSLSGEVIPRGNEDTLGMIDAALSVDAAKELTVELSIVGTDYANDWSIWVYPEVEMAASDVVYTRSAIEAAAELKAGKKVLYNPAVDDKMGEANRFGTIFWGQLLFQQVNNMGLLCDPAHPAFASFPTDYHSDWQWWDLCTNSRIVELDELGVEPMVRVIDDFLKNRHLGLVFEAKVGAGQLVFSSIDLGTDLDQRLSAKQFKYSLLNYMNSTDFQPQKTLAFNQILAAIASK